MLAISTALLRRGLGAMASNYPASTRGGSTRGGTSNVGGSSVRGEEFFDYNLSRLLAQLAARLASMEANE